MSTNLIISSLDQPTTQVKKLWEDPCITLERELEARAQDGPPDGLAPWQRGIVGPLGSNQTCS